MSERTSDVLIAGAGPAGLTAALYARRAGHSVTVLEKLFPGGQMTTTPEIENYPGLPGITGFALSQGMEKQARALGAQIEAAEVTGFSLVPGCLRVLTAAGDYRGRSLILALGARRRTLDIPGEAEFAGRGVSYCATCDGAFFKGRDVAVVGGGNTALEDALYLAGICRRVTLVHRRDAFRGGRVLEERVRGTSNITLKLNAVPAEISGAAALETLSIRPAAGGERETLSVSAVFVAVGTIPETSLLEGLLPLDEAGRILAGEDTCTPIPGVFAAGDLRTKPLFQIVTATADGAVAAQEAGVFLAEEVFRGSAE